VNKDEIVKRVDSQIRRRVQTERTRFLVQSAFFNRGEKTETRKPPKRVFYGKP
jgi:hypothetical protein